MKSNLSELESEIDFLIKEENFSGSILVAHKASVLTRKSNGLANIELEVLNTPNTKFRLGSVTKIFTATAIMQLHEKKVIDIESPVNKFIPDYPNGDEITIFHLLTHTSGIPNLTEFPDFMEWVMTNSSIADTVGRFKNKPLDFQPGHKFKYSNSGYILLSYIIELVTDKPYADFIRETIFAPLEMMNSGMDNHESIIKNRASGYNFKGESLINAPYINMSNPAGAASMYSTVDDLFLFDQALYKDGILKRDTLEMMFQPFKKGYGLGWIVQDKLNQRMVSHGGGIHGFSANFSRYLDSETSFIVLSNIFYPKSKIEFISNQLAEITFQKLSVKK